MKIKYIREEEMKKVAIALIAGFAFIQSAAYGATSALVESLLEYEAITDSLGAPNQTYISQGEFVVDVKRITRETNILGEVKYKIVTEEIAEFDWWIDESSSSSSHRHHRHECNNRHVYIATLLVMPNPAIGPNIVSVLKIVPARHY